MTRDIDKSRCSEGPGVYKTVHKPLDRYLKKRPDGKSDKYYLVYPVPRELREVVGARYERKSTNTANLSDARRTAAKLAALLEDKFRVLLSNLAIPNRESSSTSPSAVSVSLSEDLIESFCERWRISHLHSDDRERDDGLDGGGIEEIETYAKAIELDAREINAMGKNAPCFVHVSEEATDWAETLGYLLVANDPLTVKYIRKFAAEKFAIADALRARNRGDVVLTPSMPSQYHGKSLQEYKEIWLTKHIAGLAEKTKGLYAGRIDQFIRYLSKNFSEINNMPLRSIEGRHVQAFVNFLMHEEELHPRSIRDGHLPPLRSIFNWARADGETSTEPCKNVMLSKLAKKTEAGRAQPRESFSDGFLNTLFCSSWYDKGAEGILQSPVYADLSARYWVPFILLCHGLRPIEVCQLTVSDIHYVEGLLCFKVAEDDDSGKAAKTEATRRGLPVHEKLLTAGFEQFVQQRCEEGLPHHRLFPVMEGRPEPAKWFAQAFNRYIRRFLHAPDVYTLHSFRHTWEDNRRSAQSKYGKERWPKGMHFQLSGREDIEKEEGSAKDYGKKYTAEEMRPYLNSIWEERTIAPISFEEFKAIAFVSITAKVAFDSTNATIVKTSKPPKRPLNVRNATAEEDRRR